MLSKQAKAKLAGKQGYNDKPQRKQFIKMMGTCKILPSFLAKYFKCEKTNDSYYIKENPIGDYDVDLGILRKSDNKVMGLVEVDYFKKWTGDWWPYEHTDKLNRLLRKEKYHRGRLLPYVNVSFDTSGINAWLSDKETEMKYRIVDWYIPEVDEWETGRRIRLKDAIKIGKLALNSS